MSFVGRSIPWRFTAIPPTTRYFIWESSSSFKNLRNSIDCSLDPNSKTPNTQKSDKCQARWILVYPGLFLSDERDFQTAMLQSLTKSLQDYVISHFAMVLFYFSIQ